MPESTEAVMRRHGLIKAALEHVLREPGAKTFEHWRKLVGETSVIPHPGGNSVEIEIGPIWDRGPDGPIRVLVSVLHTTKFGVTLPGTDFLVYSDGRIDVPPIDDEPVA